VLVSLSAPRIGIWCLLLISFLTLIGCGDLIDPQRQKELGVHEAVLERYNSATGFHSIIGKPTFPGLRKSGSMNVEVLDDSDPKKLEEAVMTVMQWYAESSGKMSGLKKVYLYAMKDGQPIKVAVYEAASLSGKDLDYQDPSPENLPQPGQGK